MTAAKPGRDKIVRAHFNGLRTAADVCLDLDLMTVLIGPNGVGKSTLIEGMEILHKIQARSDFIRALCAR